MISVAFVTLGCPKNEVDTAAMKALVEASAYILSDEVASADVVVVNTCSFISTATEASIETILDLAAERGDLPARLVATGSGSAAGRLAMEPGLDVGRGQTDCSLKTVHTDCFPGARTPLGAPLPQRSQILLVAGCMVNRYGAQELEGELPEVSAFVPIEGESDLLRVIEEQTGVAASVAPGGEAKATPDVGSGSPADVACDEGSASAPASAYLMIADGCDRVCSFCTIPAIRGPYRSKTPDELVAQARKLVASGVRELVLIAQDTTAYGHDLPDRPTLASLVARLCDETDLAWLRLMYLQPEGVTDELIDVVAAHPQVVRSFEMPLQHSSERILRAMNRAGGRTRFAALIATLRNRLPGLALRTTLIVGFPGETEEEFNDLLDFVRQMRFDYVGVFPYSPEDETPAAELPAQLDEDVRLARAQLVRDAADEIGWERAAAHVDQTIPVLIEAFDAEEGCFLGRASFQAPDIDGQVRIVAEEGARPDISLNAIMRVRIQDALLYDLEGILDDERRG